MTDFKKMKKKIDLEVKHISEWGYEMDIIHDNQQSRRIRLRKNNHGETTSNPVSVRSSNNYSCNSSQQKTILTVPTDHYSDRNFREHQEYEEISYEESDFNLKNDFYSKVEMISRKSAPQNTHSTFSDVHHQNTYSSETQIPGQNKLNNVNILISFGEEFIKKNNIQKKEDNKSKSRVRNKSKHQYSKFQKTNKRSYYTQASNKWNWDDGYSSSSKPISSKQNMVVQTKKSKKKQSKPYTSLLEEQKRLRKTLKSIKF